MIVKEDTEVESNIIEAEFKTKKKKVEPVEKPSSTTQTHTATDKDTLDGLARLKDFIVKKAVASRKEPCCSRY